MNPGGAHGALDGVPAQPLNADDYERLGRRASDPALADYVAGGAGSERALRANEAAFARWSLRPRIMTGVGEVDTAVTLLGCELALPLVLAPLAFLGMAGNGGELAVARAAAAAGTAMCLSLFATVALERLLREVPRTHVWLQMYLLRDRGLTRALAEQAAAAGARTLVLTADAPRLGRRERDLRSGFAIPATTPVPVLDPLARGGRAIGTRAAFELVDPAPTWARLEELAALSSLPVLVKGVLSAEDARAACDSGAAGAIVSNHGGRQLDDACASLDALPDVAEALAGRAPVLVDGGLRRGSDIVKALALGAQGALIGRPVFWALAARGESGARHLLALLAEELELALALLGCGAPDEVGPAHLAPLALRCPTAGRRATPFGDRRTAP